MELASIVQALRREWRWAVGVFAVGVAAVVGLVASPPPTYTSSVTVVVQPSSDGATGGGIAMVQFLMPALQARVQSRTMAADVLRELPAAASVTVSAVNDPGTSLLTITTSGAQDAVQPAASAYAAALIASQARAKGSPVQVVVLDPASPTAVLPGRGLMTLLAGGLLSAILGVAAAVGVNRLRRRGGFASEVAARLGVPVLGELPRFRTNDRARLQPNSMYGDSDVVAVEALMRLRTSLEIQLHSRSFNSVSIVSRDAGEGKTTVAMHVAWSLSLVGHRVCLVEADLRRPSLVRYLGDGVGPPEQTPAGRRVLSTSLPKLRLAPARLLRQIAGDSRTGQTFDMHPSDVTAVVLPQLLAESLAEREIMVLDLPPLSGAAEARLAVSMTDTVVLVADVRRRDVMESLEESVQQVQEAGGSVLGVVLNRSRISRRRRKQIDAYHVRVRPAQRRRVIEVEPSDAGARTTEADHPDDALAGRDGEETWQAQAAATHFPLPLDDHPIEGSSRASRRATRTDS